MELKSADTFGFALRLSGMQHRPTYWRDPLSAVSAPSISLELAGGRVSRVFGFRIEGDRRARRGLVDDIHDRLEQRQALGRESEASADHHTVVGGALQRVFEHGPPGGVGRDHAGIALPASFLDLPDPYGNSGVDLSGIEAGR